MHFLRLVGYAGFFCLLPGVVLPFPAKGEPATVTLGLGRDHIEAEVADTPEARERGLMYREVLEPNRGMLFVLDKPEAICFWMKNTRIPLSAAFIDGNGKILSIAALKPLSRKLRCARLPVLYVLEVNRHWFDQHGVLPGSYVDQLPRREDGEWKRNWPRH